MAGWVSLDRKIIESDLHKNSKPFCEFGAWVDMILQANFSDNGDIKRGEFPTHIRTLASRWGWSISKVNRFLQALKTGSRIGSRSDQKRIIIRIEKYEEYQNDKRKAGSRTGSLPGSGSDQESDPSITRDLYNNKQRTRESREAFAPRITLTQTEYNNLKTQYGDLLTEELQKASDWSLSKGKTHKDAAAFMRNWMRRAAANERRSNVTRVDFKTIEHENKLKREREAVTSIGGVLETWGVVEPVEPKARRLESK